MNTPKNYDQKLERLRRYSRRLNRMLESGSFYELSYWKRYKQIRRIKRLYNDIIGPLSDNRLKAILAAASIFVLGGACPGGGEGDQIADSPSFAAPQQNPFGITDQGSRAAPFFADIDNDGDYDLFVGLSDGSVHYFLNTGSANSPSFSHQADNKGLPDTGSYGILPNLVNIDGDGDFDAVLGNDYSGGYGVYLGVVYYKNNGTASSPAFVSDSLPSGLPLDALFPNTYVQAPFFVDIDDDGDKDAIIAHSDWFSGALRCRLKYYEKTPSGFVDQGVQFGLDAFAGDYAFPTFVDIDADGDFDAFVGDATGNVHFFLNTGTSTNASFASPITIPYGLTTVTGAAFPTFVDIDDDGDNDAFVGDVTGNIHFFENTNL